MTERCDVYALGAVLFELASGRPASMLSQSSATQDLARDLHLIVCKAMHEDPSRR